jgi:hypothetical protein
MKSAGLTILVVVVLTIAAASFLKDGPYPEAEAIANLRSFVMAESAYAMSHPHEGFACDPQALTNLEWSESPNHAKLQEHNWQYKFSAQCVDNSKPSGKLNIFAVPIDTKTDLRTFCTTATFRPFPTKPYTEWAIRGISGGNAGSCLVSGKELGS